MDEVLRSDGNVSPYGDRGKDLVDPSFGSLPTPWGFAARYSPRDLSGFWMEIVSLTSGRIGVLLGCCPESTAGERLRTDALAALGETADPVQSLRGLAGSAVSALCAVIDRDTIRYSGHGHPGAVIAVPGLPPAEPNSPDGLPVVAPLEPGSTVLLCSGPVGPAVDLLDDCSGAHPETLADRAILALAGRGGAGYAAVLYRHPPRSLKVTLPAEPGSLSVSRGRLREWLTAAGVDSETCADVLLAVGEATANATEHAVVGAPGRVDITVEASFRPEALLLSVSDTGRWKPAAVSPGHRGHGIHLMNALVNSVQLTAAPQGTTVTMLKEPAR